MFVAHALLLRGALNSLWRQGQKALKDLQDVVNTQGLSKEVCVGNRFSRVVHSIGSCLNTSLLCVCVRGIAYCNS